MEDKKVVGYYITLDNVKHAIYDRDNNSRLTYKLFGYFIHDQYHTITYHNGDSVIYLDVFDKILSLHINEYADVYAVVILPTTRIINKFDLPSSVGYVHCDMNLINNSTQYINTLIDMNLY